MDKYTQVLMTYVTRKGVALYAGVLLFAMIFVLIDGFHPSRQPFSLLPLYYVFSLQFLGIRLKQQMASPQASLIPGYRWPHLTIAFLWLTGPLFLVAFGGWIREASVIGTSVVTFYVWLTCFYVFVWPNRFSIAACTFDIIVFFVPHLRAVVFDIILGREPVLAWSLFSAEAAAVVLLFHHLATLTEDDPDYGQVIPLVPEDLKSATIRKQQRAVMLKFGRFTDRLYASASRRLDRITQTPAKTFWERVALHRMNEDWPTNWWFTIAILTGIELFVVKRALPPILTEQAFRHAALFPLMISTIFSLGAWITAYPGGGRLGYESLRPATRHQWVLGNATAMLMKVGQVQIAWLLIQGAVLLIYVPEFSTSGVLLEVFVCWIGWQILIFGLNAWVAFFGSFGLKLRIMAAMSGLMSLGLIPISVLNEQQSRGLWLITGTAAGTIGLGMCAIAYRRWCRIDFV